MSAEFIPFREPSEPERGLLAAMARLATDVDPAWIEGIKVRSMNDGGMGSLELAPQVRPAQQRCFGKKVAEYQFVDADGVEVVVSLNVDADGTPFELDIWKTDFSPLVQMPTLQRDG
jgi:hypothetical protein